MPKYINSSYLSGGNFVVRDNGRVFKRTGNTVTKSAAYAAREPKFSSTSLVIERPEVDKVMYVSTCSAAEKGEFILPKSGTLSVDVSAGEFQMKFEGGSAGDTGILELRDTASTCNVQLSVNSADNLVWDTGATGTPNNYEFITYPTTLSYTDCNNNVLDITLASLGSFILTGKKTGAASPGACSGILYSSTHALDLSGTLGLNHSVDACFTSSCPSWHANAHHYHNILYNGGWGADIYAQHGPGSGEVLFTLSLIDRNTTYPTFNRSALEAASGSTVCADCAGLSAHSFSISGANATGSLHDPTSTFGAGELGSDWAIPCAGCGGNVQSLVLAISGQAGTAPINWSTGLDAHGNQALYCINFTGDDWKWTLSKYAP
jgi:hypothetical protein